MVKTPQKPVSRQSTKSNGSVNTSAFIVTYVVKLPRSRLMASVVGVRQTCRRNFRLARHPPASTPHVYRMANRTYKVMLCGFHVNSDGILTSIIELRSGMPGQMLDQN